VFLLYKYCYSLELLGNVRHPWIMSNGFSRVHFTVLFPFTLAGRLLAPVFIFHAERGKRLSKEFASWEEELLPPPHPNQKPQHALFFCNPKGYMDAEIYCKVLWLLHRELMEERKEDSSHYPHVHLLHDRAPAHTESHIAQVLVSLNMSATLVPLTSHLQIFDVGIGRVVRPGYLAEQTLFFCTHDLRVGGLVFIEVPASGSTRKKILGPCRIHVIDKNSQTITVCRSQSQATRATYPISQASNYFISKPAYRKLAVIFTCNVWYKLVDKKLIQKLATRTGQDVSLDLNNKERSEEGNVSVYVGQSRVSFETVRNGVFAEFDPKARKVEPLAFDQGNFEMLKDSITAAAEKRREARKPKHKRKKKSLSSNHPKAPPRKRGRPPQKQAADSKANSVSDNDNLSGDEESESVDDSTSDLDSDEEVEPWMELKFLAPKQIREFQSTQSVDLKSPLELGELVVIAASPDFTDTQTFYVGEITKETDPDTGQFCFQFYNNAAQNLYGKYAPAWLDTSLKTPKEDYCFKPRKKSYCKLTSWGLLDWILSRHVQLTSKSKKLPVELEKSLKQLIDNN